MADPTFSKLDSHRLVLRRFSEPDFDSFLAYRSDPDVARYQSWENYSRNDARREVEDLRTLHPNIPGRWFQFAIEVKTTNEMIGDCALLTLAADPGQAEVGFTLASEHQGRGYAAEALRCLLDYVFISL